MSVILFHLSKYNTRLNCFAGVFGGLTSHNASRVYCFGDVTCVQTGSQLWAGSLSVLASCFQKHPNASLVKPQTKNVEALQNDLDAVFVCAK